MNNSGPAVPWIPVLIYVSIRASIDHLNTRCWVPNAGNYEWLIYCPIILCLLGNIFFLGKILFVMLTQLQSHPNEPSSYRRAAKAAAILVPLFGLQTVMVIARPSDESYVFEICSKIITNTQVLSVLRNALPRSWRARSLLRSDQRSTMSTQFTTDAGSRSQHTRGSAYHSGNNAGYGPCQQGGGGYIPLTTINDDAKAKGNGETTNLHNGAA